MAAWDILYRANVSWYYLGQNCINSFFFRTQATSSYASILDEMTDLNGQLGTFFWGSMRAMISNQCQLLSHTLVNLNGPQFYQIVNPFSGVFGNVSSAGLPSFCASVVSWHTAYRGRRVHGRTYIPAVPTSMVTGNDLNSGGLAALDNFAGIVLSRFGLAAGHSWPFLVVYSRKNGNGISPGPPPAVTYDSLAGVPVSRYVIDNFVCTQRHRFESRGI